MTSPNSVGEVSVEVLADARKLAKDLKDKVEKSFKDLDLGAAIKESVKKSGPIKLPVTPDTDGLPEKVKEETKGRLPKLPVELDPLLAAFQEEVRRQVTALARTANAKIPVGADTDGLRAEIGAELAAVQRQLKAQIPVEPSDQAEYAAKLKAAVDQASARVKASVPAEPERGDFEAKLRAEVAAAASRVKAQVKIQAKVDQGAFAGLSGGLRGLIPDIGGVGSAIAGLGEGVAKFASFAAAGGSQLAGSIAQAAGPISAVIGLLASAGTAMGALGAAAILVVPAMSAVAGAAAAIPAALAGVGAVFGTFGLGLKGISEAFKKKPAAGGGGGGGGGANSAKQQAAAARQVEAAKRGIAAADRQVEAAERSLAAAQRGVAEAEARVGEAQKRVLGAQQAINRARVEAVEDIEDLNRSLRGAKLSEEDAAVGVEEALRALGAAKLSGQIPDIKRADLAYRQALQTLDEARDTTDDLSKATDEANKKGVEGSDKVQDAYRDQAEALKAVQDAQRGVLDAQEGVRSAQDGLASAYDGVKSAADSLKAAQDSLAQSQQKVGGGAAGVTKEVIKLAPAAQRFVDAIKALKPAFESLRLDVQQRLFQGLDKTVTNLGNAWIPRLKQTLGSYADTFNQFFRNLGTAVTTPKFMDDLQAGAEGARQAIETVGQAVTSKLVPALGALAKAGGPFLSRLGAEIASIVTQFSNWVLQGEKTGGLKSFFDRAATALHDIFRTGKLVTQIVGDIISILTGPSTTNGSPIDSFNNGLQKIHDFLSDPATQAQIRGFVDDLANGLKDFGQAVKTVNDFLDDVGGDGSTKGQTAGENIGRAIVAGVIAGIGFAFKEQMKFFIDNIFLFGLIGQIKEILGIKSPSTVMMEVGGDLIRGLMLGISNFVGQLRSRVDQIRINITNRLSSAGTWLLQTGKNAVNGLMTGISNMMSGLGVRVSAIRTRVTGALSTAGTWLYTHGSNIITGLWNGISSLGGWLYNKVWNFVRDHVVNPAKNFLGIASPSKLMAVLGGYTAEGLADGMTAKAGLVEDAAARLAESALPAMPDMALQLGMSDASLASSLALADSKSLQAGWKPDATGDQVLDALARMIDFKYNSDVDAAFTRTRR